MTETIDRDYLARKEAEVHRNFEAFQARIDEHMADHAGEFALMRGGEVVDFYPSWEAARKAGKESFSDRMYSVQKVTKTPEDMGWDSRVVRIG